MGGASLKIDDGSNEPRNPARETVVLLTDWLGEGLEGVERRAQELEIGLPGKPGVLSRRLRDGDERLVRWGAVR